MRHTPGTQGPENPENEAAFMAAVLDLARWNGWLAFHDQDSRRNPAGLPDLILCRPPRLIFAELKTATGRLRGTQQAWLAALSACPKVETYVWRPADWPTIEQRLV